MPQIWLTLDELGTMMDCDLESAHEIAVRTPLTRRRSRDGRVRVKLNGALTEVFLDALLRQRPAQNLDTCIEALRSVGSQMASQHGAPPRADRGLGQSARQAR
ncbi:MAG TPA: hypothetical protein VNR11_05870 [Xanthobacteraceae bacterium]|nr:hypothetical protein [Xanthobacteraceae bacterium]